MSDRHPIAVELYHRFPDITFTEQQTKDGIPTFWVAAGQAHGVLTYLKTLADRPFSMLFDLFAIDERARRTPSEQPAADFSVAYHLLSIDRNADVRLKVPLQGEFPSIRTITDIWPCANWYEREVWDMFGITVTGHPFLKRILNPPDWVGHPLRKEYPARATDLVGYTLPDETEEMEERELQIHPEEFGFTSYGGDTEFMFLNLGPHHPGTHGLMRMILQLDGERVSDSHIDIGWHHRAAEKMAERQTFHTYIPYTDRVDYLAGVLNEMPYVLSAERLAGIEAPPRAQYLRVMLSELFRIANHLVWFGTLAADLGALSPVFFTFNDRERIFDIVEAVCGGRMHPQWFRVGGVRDELPNGWKGLVDDFVSYFPARLVEYNRMMVRNRVFHNRLKGVGPYTTESALEWGVTGPNLRATGLSWDLRKRRPYSSYDHFDFEIPTATEGDSFARCIVRMEEMAQSLRIVKQAADNMPDGPHKSDSRYAMPPEKVQTMQAIETLINHFLSVSWGQPIPPGEASVPTEGAKGNYAYHLISDGSNWAYRCHIRTASFPHLQTLPMLCKGLLISDVIAVLGSIDYVMGDVDR